MKNAIRITLLIFNLLAVFGLVAAYLSVYVSPEKQWLAALVGLCYPLLVLINVLFVLLWLFSKAKPWALLSLITILLGLSYLSKNFQFSGRSSDDTDVRVLSYNVKAFSGNDAKKANENAERIVSFLDEQKADIICLQESRLRFNKVFNLEQTVKKLKNIKHYQFARSSSTFGLVTMTRYPIVDMGEIRFENSGNISIYTDVRINADTVRIYNLHLHSYRINPKTYAEIEASETDDAKRKEAVKVVLKQMRDAWKMRAVQVENIRKHIDESPYRVIVCGDFNDAPTSYSYRVVSEGLEDAFVESGSGIGRTYIGPLPSFRIDFILHSPAFEAYNFETIDFRYSDHLPVVCDLKTDL